MQRQQKKSATLKIREKKLNEIKMLKPLQKKSSSLKSNAGIKHLFISCHDFEGLKDALATEQPRRRIKYVKIIVTPFLDSA